MLFASVIMGLAALLVAAACWRLAVSLMAAGTLRRAVADIERQALQADRGEEIALVRGRIVVTGEGCKPPDGTSAGTKACAAAATWGSAWRLIRKNGKHLEGERAERLVIESSAGPVELSGPLELAMGSQLCIGDVWLPINPTRRFTSQTALFHGDEVLAIGVRKHGPDDARDKPVQYRTPAGGAVLAPMKDGRLPIAAVRLSRTKVSLDALFSSPVMWPVFLLALGAASTAKVVVPVVAELFRADDSCARYANCNTLFHTTNDADCRNAPRACLVSGRCYADHGHCVARSELDCELSIDCQDRGRCQLSEDACVADGMTDIFCGGDDVHREDVAPCDGRCSGAPGEPCASWLRPSPTRPSMCQQHECAPSCAETDMCRILGLCAPSRRTCVATKEGCAASERCRLRGNCSMDQWGRCVIDEGTGCSKTEVCAKYGWCKAVQLEFGEDHYHEVCFARPLEHTHL